MPLPFEPANDDGRERRSVRLFAPRYDVNNHLIHREDQSPPPPPPHRQPQPLALFSPSRRQPTTPDNDDTNEDATPNETTSPHTQALDDAVKYAQRSYNNIIYGTTEPPDFVPPGDIPLPAPSLRPAHRTGSVAERERFAAHKQALKSLTEKVDGYKKQTKVRELRAKIEYAKVTRRNQKLEQRLGVTQGMLTGTSTRLSKVEAELNWRQHQEKKRVEAAVKKEVVAERARKAASRASLLGGSSIKGAEPDDGIHAHDAKIQGLFRNLRDAVYDLAKDAPLPMNFNSPRRTALTAAAARLRRYQIMAHTFDVLFRRILSSDVKSFGLDFVGVDVDGEASKTLEGHLRGLEAALEKSKVSGAGISAWVSATVSVVEPLSMSGKNIGKTVAAPTQEILETFTFEAKQSKDKITSSVAAICERAILLKLAMRKASVGGYKVEVPGSDIITAALPKWRWMEVKKERIKAGESEEVTGSESIVPFGFLTRYGDAGSAEDRYNKVILEKAWVVEREK